MKKSIWPLGLSFFGLVLLADNGPLIGDKVVTLAGPAGRFDFMEVDSTSHRLLAAHKQAKTLEVLDLKNEKVLASIPTGTNQGVAVDEKNHRYFVGDEDEKKIVFIDSVKLKKVGEVKVDGPVDAIAYDSNNHQIFADEDNGSKIWAIDADSIKLIAPIVIPGKPEVIVYDSKTDKIFQNLKDKDSVIMINPDSYKIEGTWSTAPATSPHGLAVDQKRGRVFSAGGNGKLVAIEINSGKIVGTADIEPKVDQISYDPETEIVYCATKGFISIVKVSDSGLTSLGKVPSPQGAHTIAVDGVTHNVWVSYADSKKSYLQKFKPSK